MKAVRHLVACVFALGLVCLPVPSAGSSSQAGNQGLEQKISTALAGIEPAVQIAGRSYQPASLQELMEKHKVPAVSIAIVKDGELAWAGAYGLAAVGRPATTDTIFQAASISKPVTAMAVLEMAEQGRLSLDAPVNASLTSWQVPDSDAGQGDAVTLRQILSHRAGLTARGFDGYEVGSPLPTLVQILNGAPPANSEAVRIAFPPGGEARYSGGGYTVAQQLLMDVGRATFPTIMDEQVLEPAGMSRSMFGHPFPQAGRSRSPADMIAKGRPSPMDTGFSPSSRRPGCGPRQAISAAGPLP